MEIKNLSKLYNNNDINNNNVNNDDKNNDHDNNVKNNDNNNIYQISILSFFINKQLDKNILNDMFINSKS
jgi:hypothetical protein